MLIIICLKLYELCLFFEGPNVEKNKQSNNNNIQNKEINRLLYLRDLVDMIYFIGRKQHKILL